MDVHEKKAFNTPEKNEEDRFSELIREMKREELRGSLKHVGNSYKPKKSSWKKWSFIGSVLLIIGTSIYFLKDEPLASKEKQLLIQEQQIDKHQTYTDSRKATPVKSDNTSSIPQRPQEKTDSVSVSPETGHPKEKLLLADTTRGVIIKDTKPIDDSKKSIVQTFVCDGVTIQFDYTTTASCIKNSSGKIQLLAHSIKGGTPPYTFGLGGENFSSSTSFSSLSSGNYDVFVKDANGCLDARLDIRVKSKNCDQKQGYITIVPDQGIFWKIPTSKSGDVQIISKNGKIVYNTSFSENQAIEWQGNGASFGLYNYIISYEDGVKVTGILNVMR